MKPLILGVAVGTLLMGGVGLAQTQGTAPAGAAPSAAPSSPTGTTSMAPAAPSAGADRGNNVDQAAGNNNQAVATTSANAPAPAKGANSFTMGEAKSRIEKNGFSNIGDLTKDDNGVWHGSAQKGGNTTTVWLDYKGNVGEGNPGDGK